MQWSAYGPNVTANRVALRGYDRSYKKTEVRGLMRLCHRAPWRRQRCRCLQRGSAHRCPAVRAGQMLQRWSEPGLQGEGRVSASALLSLQENMLTRALNGSNVLDQCEHAPLVAKALTSPVTPHPTPNKTAPATSRQVMSAREGRRHFGAARLYKGPLSSTDSFRWLRVWRDRSLARLASTRGLTVTNQPNALGRIPAMATMASEGSHIPARRRAGTKLKKPRTFDGRCEERKLSTLALPSISTLTVMPVKASPKAK